MRKPSRLLSIVLAVAIVAAAATTLAVTLGSGSTAGGRASGAAMVRIPEGRYIPLYRSPEEAESVPVAAFYMDVYPVTNRDFLAFVREHPEWRRSQVNRLFADENYLKHWNDDLDFGPDSLADRPVVNVSWFAATAFAEAGGRRLPTTAEWERVAAAGPDRAEGSKDPAYMSKLLSWYSSPSTPAPAPVGSTFSNYYGVWDLHGLVWEWVLDFNTAVVSGDSRNGTDLDRVLFCGSGSVGAGQFDDYTAFLRFGYRGGLNADYTVPNLGFRTVRDAEPES